MTSGDGYLDVTPQIRIPLAELRWQMSRSSGPGGQNVNKVNTKVQLWWDLPQSTVLTPEAAARLRAQNPGRVTRDGEFQLECQQFRSQLANRQACLEELATLVRRALVRPKTRRPSKPTRGSKERRLQSKRERSQKKSTRRFRPGAE